MRRETCVEEQRAIGFAEVEKNVLWRGLMAGRGHVQPLERIGLVAGAEFIEPVRGIRKLRFEFDGNFRAYFVAAPADGRADGSEQAIRPRAELHLHFPNGFCDDALQRAAPAGMNGGDGSLFGIDEKNGDAIGGLNAEKQAGANCCGGVPATGLGGHGIEDLHNIRMELPEGNEREIVCIERTLKEATIFENKFPRVPLRETEIQDPFAFESADAARPGAEAVDEPGNFRERRRLQNSNALGDVLGPSGR